MAETPETLMALARETAGKGTGSLPWSAEAEEFFAEHFRPVAENPILARAWPKMGAEVLAWLLNACRGAAAIVELRRMTPQIERADLVLAFAIGFGSEASHTAGYTRCATHFCPPIPDGIWRDTVTMLAPDASRLRAVEG